MCIYDDNVNYVHGNNYLLCVRNDFVYTFFFYYYFFNCVQFCFNVRTARQNESYILRVNYAENELVDIMNTILLLLLWLWLFWRRDVLPVGGLIFFVKQIDRILYASYIILIFIILILYKTKRISYFNAISRKKLNMYIPRNNRIAIN
jgi:hypothetical protein